MIGRFLGELVWRIAGGLLFGKRRAPPITRRRRSRPREVMVTPAEKSTRAHAYQTWAVSRGLELVLEDHVGGRGARFRGTRCGRAIELTTGLPEYGLPRSPELLLYSSALSPAEPLLLSSESPLPGAAAATEWGRQITAVLDVEGVRDIGVTTRFVRLCFDPFVSPRTLEDGWAALESALAAISKAANTTEPSLPYR